MLHGSGLGKKYFFFPKKKSFPHSRHHWAPIWMTCGLCHHIPDYVLKVNNLSKVLGLIF